MLLTLAIRLDDALHLILGHRCWCPRACEWLSARQAQRELAHHGTSADMEYISLDHWQDPSGDQ